MLSQKRLEFVQKLQKNDFNIVFFLSIESHPNSSIIFKR